MLRANDDHDDDERGTVYRDDAGDDDLDQNSGGFDDGQC